MFLRTLSKGSFRRYAEPVPDQQLPRREIRDAQTARAMAHPLRIRLVEELAFRGPMTATQLAERLGESPANCSWHLRQLAKYGFVEEAGGGPGRLRPWRLSHIGMRFTDVHEDPETAIAARALDRTLRERYFAHLQEFYASRDSYPREWQATTGGSEFILHVTPDELRAVDQQVTEILMSYKARLEDPALRPPGSLPVEVLLFAYPLRHPGDQE